MEIIKNRIFKLRSELDKINSNREKLDYLNNYYKYKNAIIVATGPNFIDYIDLIKNNINENTILICTKQTIKYFDMIADFHILNWDHLEEYEYNYSYKPITLFINYNVPDENNFRIVNNYGDINFFLCNLNNINHERKNSWDYLETDIDFLSMNDNNLGKDENMVLNTGHIIMELGLPICVHLGIKNIILNGFVGGNSHGTIIENELNWDKDEYKHLYSEQELLYEKSKHLQKYLHKNFNINIFSLCNTNYYIDKISENEFKNILNYNSLCIVHYKDTKYDVGGLVRFFIHLFYDVNISNLFIKNGLKLFIFNSDNYNEIYDKIIDSNLNLCNNKKIFFGIHPFGFKSLYNYINRIGKQTNDILIGWVNDPHFFAYFITENNEKVDIQKYDKEYEPMYLSNSIFNYFITPSPIYFKNLNINKYNHKIKFLFYLLNYNYFDKIKINNFNERKNEIILSGCVGGNYKSRIQFLNLKQNKNLDNLIYHLEHPGYTNNEHMTELNYYKKLEEYKGAFVGLLEYPINYLVAKHIEVLMCGCLGFFEKSELLKEELGLEEFVHYIPCTDDNGNVISDDTFYINWLNSEKGLKIAYDGAKYVREKFGEKYIMEYINFFNSCCLS